MKHPKYIILACAVALALTALGGSPGGSAPGKGGMHTITSPMVSGDYTIFDVNRVRTYIRNNGSFDRDPGTGNSGYEWPKGTGNTAIYASGLWLGAKRSDTVCVAVAEYSYEFDAGPILAGGVPADPEDSRYKMYKIQRGETFSDEAIAQGAPTEMLGDMMVFSVFNEADPSVHVNMNAPPLGVEVQMTTFAFNRSDALGNVIFYKWKIINKGGRNLDSTYITIWSDPDLGDSGDDYDGCDTTLGLGFTYNGDAVDGVYGIPPAVGFDFLQGPLVNGAPTDTARFPDGRVFPGKKLLKMTSFIKYSNDATNMGNPSTGQEVFNYQKGLDRDGRATPGSNGSPFMYPGDPSLPASATNWIETDPPGDRRFMMSAGPFTMAAGDTQEIVAASLIAQSTSTAASVIALKQADLLVQTAYDLDFGLAPPPDPPPVSATASDQTVFLTWGDGDQNAQIATEIEATETLDPIAALAGASDSTYNFQGYVVYQVANASGDDPRIIGTYDLADGTKLIYDDVFDPNVGAIVSKPVKFGDDTGIKRTVHITTDKYTGLPLSNQKDYYYIVTSYTYNPESIPKTLESARDVITVRPTKLPGRRLTSAYGDTLAVRHTSGGGDGSVVPLVVDPTKTTGHTYNIGFELDSATISYKWFVRDSVTGLRVISDQFNQSGDAVYPTFDGIQATVIGPPNGMKDWDIPSGARRWTWAGADGFELEGFEHAMGNGYEHWFSGSTVTPANLYDVLIKLAATDIAGNLLTPGDTTASLGYRYLRRAAVAPARPEFAPFILNPTAGYAFQEFGRAGAPNIPFAAYNAVTGQRLMVGHLENNVVDGTVDGIYWPPYSNSGVDNVASTGPREWWFIFDVPYSTTSDPSLAVDILNETLPLVWMGTPNRRGDNIAFQSGDEFLIISNKVNTDADVFAFTAPAAASPSVDNQKADLNLINAVPNPYFGSNAYERDQFNRIVRFTNLPPTANIRIFNVAGSLVRTLRKEDASTSIDWDLLNENALPVASGMYIVHVEIPGVGEKVLKIAVILAQERLDNF